MHVMLIQVYAWVYKQKYTCSKTHKLSNTELHPQISQIHVSIMCTCIHVVYTCSCAVIYLCNQLLQVIHKYSIFSLLILTSPSTLPL